MKQRGVFLIGLIIITFYYFFFPRDSGKELVVLPDSLLSLDKPQTTVTPSPGQTLAIHNGQRTGFISMDHELISLYTSDKMAVDDRWLAISGPNGLEIHEPDGRLISRINNTAFPVTRNGNLFLYQDEFGILSKIDPANGRTLWEKEYISPLTVLDGRAGRTLVGLLDGRAQLIDDSGTVILEYRPGGSRVEAIYGGTLSSDGTKIALISGLDPQRFILLEERKNGFRPVAHHNTETDFRRWVPMGFVRDNQQVLYESGDFVAAVEMNGYEIHSLEHSGRLSGWLDNTISETLILLGKDKGEVSIKMLSRNDLVVFEGLLPPDTSGIRRDRNFALIVGDDNLAILEFSVK